MFKFKKKFTTLTLTSALALFANAVLAEEYTIKVYIADGHDNVGIQYAHGCKEPKLVWENDQLSVSTQCMKGNFYPRTAKYNSKQGNQTLFLVRAHENGTTEPMYQ